MYAVPVSPLALSLLSPTRVPNLNTMHFWRNIVVLVIFVVYHAAAQGTNATCLEGYDWMTNSLGQGPCLVTAYLWSACHDDPTDEFILYSLPEHYHYVPPAKGGGTLCKCSTVSYSTMSACSVCQGGQGEIVEWSTWIDNCSPSSTHLDQWPTSVPSNTSIPRWAFLDVATRNSFNVSQAEALAESELASSRSNVGPIIGGVIGGIGGAAILAGIAAFFILRYKHNSRSVPSAAFTPAPTNVDHLADPPTPYDAEKLYDTSSPYFASVFAGAYPSPLGQTSPTHNVKNPSTFPPPPPRIRMEYMPSLYNSSIPLQQHAAYGYSGAPEV